MKRRATSLRVRLGCRAGRYRCGCSGHGRRRGGCIIIGNDHAVFVFARDIGCHNGFIDFHAVANRARDEPAFHLLVVRGAIRKPAFEFMICIADQSIFNHLTSAVQQSIKLAVTLQRVEIIAAAHMRGADENLRHSPAAIGALGHFFLFGMFNLIRGCFVFITSRKSRNQRQQY